MSIVILELDNVEYFKDVSSLTNDARRTRETISRIAMEKSTFYNKKALHQQTGLKFNEETNKVPHLKHSFFGKWIINTWEDLKCGAGEGWLKSAGPIV